MNIDTLMQQVRQVIRERGALYHAEGKIKISGEAQATVHRALVQGSRVDAQYLVEIIYTSTGHVVSHCCTCPYDNEDLCKHQIAVLIELRQQLRLKLKEKKDSEIARFLKGESSIYNSASLPGKDLEKLVIHSLHSDALLYERHTRNVTSQRSRSESDHYESGTPHLDWLRPPAGDGFCDFGDFGGE